FIVSSGFLRSFDCCIVVFALFNNTDGVCFFLMLKVRLALLFFFSKSLQTTRFFCCVMFSKLVFLFVCVFCATVSTFHRRLIKWQGCKSFRFKGSCFEYIQLLIKIFFVFLKFFLFVYAVLMFSYEIGRFICEFINLYLCFIHLA